MCFFGRTFVSGLLNPDFRWLEPKSMALDDLSILCTVWVFQVNRFLMWVSVFGLLSHSARNARWCCGGGIVR